jgi:hypothetical protein
MNEICVPLNIEDEISTLLHFLLLINIFSTRARENNQKSLRNFDVKFKTNL